MSCQNHIIFRVKQISAALLIAAATAQSAQATVRGCEYDVYVKADGIRSTIVPGSSMRSEGEVSNRIDFSRGMARVSAAWAAETCLRDVMARGGVPATCVENRRHDTRLYNGKMTRFEFGSLPINARQTVCAMAKIKGDRILRNVRIYTKVRGRSEDVKRECSLPIKGGNISVSDFWAQAFLYSPYYTLADYKRFNCTPYQ